nr:ATP-binding protein [Palleronia pontilimi]
MAGLTAVAALCVAAALTVQGGPSGSFLAAGAVTLAGVVTILAVATGLRRASPLRVDRHLRTLFQADQSPVFVTDAQGVVLWRNARSSTALGISDGLEILDALARPDLDLQPSVAVLLGQARSSGMARGGIRLDGAARTLALTRVSSDRVVWRLEPETGQRAGAAWQLRSDGDGNIMWISPDLLDQLDASPLLLADLFVDPPLRPDTTQGVRLANRSVQVYATRRELGDGLQEITFTEARDEDPSGQFESLPVPLLQLERDGSVTRANRLARQLLLLEPGEVATLQSLVEGLGRQVADWLADAFDGRARGRPEVMRASRAVGDLFVQVTLDQAGDGSDGPMMAVLSDATELKTLEAQFVQSQKMQAIGQLAGGVAHDFNNLLTAISGHCDLLLLRHDPGDQDFADLEQINQNANRAASLVGQLLAFSRKQNLRPETLDLRDILSDLTHLLNRLVGERVSLSISHDPNLQMVRADKRQLEQVIMNLVVNARDAMPEGGTIQILTRMLQLDLPEPHGRVDVPAGRYTIVEVIDQGIGIPDDKMPKIFEPFFTTKRTGEGTGLGLSTAYGIVKQTGGYIFARSEVGKGTTFSLYFPASAAPSSARRVEIAPPKVASTGREGRILLVEDEAPVRAFAARALRLRGHQVIEAEHAEAALKIVQDPSVRIDVFVTDVIMPGRDGPSWVREALVQRPDTRVIFVSGYAEESFAENQAAIPQSRFLPKPFSLVDLTSAVEAELSLAAQTEDA